MKRKKKNKYKGGGPLKTEASAIQEGVSPYEVYYKQFQADPTSWFMNSRNLPTPSMRAAARQAYIDATPAPTLNYSMPTDTARPAFKYGGNYNLGGILQAAGGLASLIPGPGTAIGAGLGAAGTIANMIDSPTNYSPIRQNDNPYGFENGGPYREAQRRGRVVTPFVGSQRPRQQALPVTRRPQPKQQPPAKLNAGLSLLGSFNKGLADTASGTLDFLSLAQRYTTDPLVSLITGQSRPDRSQHWTSQAARGIDTTADKVFAEDPTLPGTDMARGLGRTVPAALGMTTSLPSTIARRLGNYQAARGPNPVYTRYADDIINDRVKVKPKNETEEFINQMLGMKRGGNYAYGGVLPHGTDKLLSNNSFEVDYPGNATDAKQYGGQFKFDKDEVVDTQQQIVYSDEAELGIDGKSPADIVKPFHKAKGKAEKYLDSVDPTSPEARATKAMMERLSDKVFQVQETKKAMMGIQQPQQNFNPGGEYGNTPQNTIPQTGYYDIWTPLVGDANVGNLPVEPEHILSQDNTLTPTSQSTTPAQQPNPQLGNQEATSPSTSRRRPTTPAATSSTPDWLPQGIRTPYGVNNLGMPAGPDSISNPSPVDMSLQGIPTASQLRQLQTQPLTGGMTGAYPQQTIQSTTTQPLVGRDLPMQPTDVATNLQAQGNQGAKGSNLFNQFGVGDYIQMASLPLMGLTMLGGPETVPMQQAQVRQIDERPLQQRLTRGLRSQLQDQNRTSYNANRAFRQSAFANYLNQGRELGTDVAQRNKQLAAQTEQYNIQQANLINDLNARNRANYRTGWRTQIASLNQLGQGLSNRATNERGAQLIGQSYPVYEYLMNDIMNRRKNP